MIARLRSSTMQGDLSNLEVEDFAHVLTIVRYFHPWNVIREGKRFIFRSYSENSLTNLQNVTLDNEWLSE